MLNKTSKALTQGVTLYQSTYKTFSETNLTCGAQCLKGDTGHTANNHKELGGGLLLSCITRKGRETSPFRNKKTGNLFQAFYTQTDTHTF